MNLSGLIPLLLAMALAPLMAGIINRTKALVGGRVGPPLLQSYFDLLKLASKGAVYSRTTSWVFRAGPIVALAAVLTAATLMPLGNFQGLFSFKGDLILFVYLLALGRFFTVSAALDTGSPFEGMGGSREMWFSALAEPALLLGMAAVAKEALGSDPSNSFTLNQIHAHVTPALWLQSGIIVVFVAVAFMIVFLAENSRIPVDDPTTHLELTMVHEVMVLDHCGPDFAFITYAAALKMWVLGALVVGLVVPATKNFTVDMVTALLGMFVVAVGVGIIESTMARLRLPRVSQLLIGATTLAALALVLEYRAV